MTHIELFEEIFGFVTKAGKLTNQAKSAFGATTYELNGIAASYEDDGNTRAAYVAGHRFHDTVGQLDFGEGSTEILEKIYNCLVLKKDWNKDVMTDQDWLAYFVNTYPNSDLVGTPAANKD